MFNFGSKITAKTILQKVYPVGSIYMSVNNASPATLFGGTWEQIQDRFLLAAGSTYSAGATGGAATHTLTVDEMPSHGHGGFPESPWHSYGADFGGQSDRSELAVNFNLHVNSVNSHPYKYGVFGSNMYVGGSKTHNNMPPYLTVYVWKRTA